MTLITFSDGKVVLRDGKAGTETSCCCEGTPCTCPNLLFDVEVQITLARSYGICGVAEFNTPIVAYLNGNYPCSNNIFTAEGDLDTTLCDPEEYCGGFRVFFQIVGECDCTSTDVCEVEIVGWEPISCPDGIQNVELV